ncbi:RPA1 [Symbiodinium sp. CCMP2592]|nr:RPA1 [Symbiodinium sp. CCMP2592]
MSGKNACRPRFGESLEIQLQLRRSLDFWLAETLNLCGDAQQPGLPVEVRHVRKVPAERVFKVKLQKLEDGFGLKYDASDSNVLLVQRVGKFGLMSSSEMLRAIEASSGSVELGFERPQLKEFSVRRFGQKLGLILQKLKSQTVLRSLPVKSLEANGVLMKKNLADAETHLKPHDRIIQALENTLATAITRC